jgi:transposase-like protein
LDSIKSGVRQSQVAKDLSVNESTIWRWKRDKVKLREMVLDMHANNNKVLQIMDEKI